MATERHKIVRRAHLNIAVDESHQKLSDALGINVPERHPVRIRDKELLVIVNGEYQVAWFDGVVDAIKKLKKENKALKTQNTKLKKQPVKKPITKPEHEEKTDGEKTADSGDKNQPGDASITVEKTD